MIETPCRRPHHATPPQLNLEAAADEVPHDCEEGDVRGLWLGGARVLDLNLDRPELLDLRIEDSDISGVVMTGFVARRVVLSGTRLRGVTLVRGQYDDGVVTGCPTSDLSFRFSRLRQVVFRDCDLSGADFTNTTFDHVTIDHCDLQRARFDAAVVNCLAITDCNLVGITGVSGLKGAQVDASDLPGLATSLALETGLRIRDA